MYNGGGFSAKPKINIHFSFYIFHFSLNNAPERHTAFRGVKIRGSTLLWAHASLTRKTAALLARGSGAVFVRFTDGTSSFVPLSVR